ncbi:MAG TPA: guanylate kinase [Planctomycetaceae bacterium]|jgi:guanylate kinase|nr:guanylate kinase [Planctomycetaceae bacterium]
MSNDAFAEMQFVVLSGPSGSGKTTIVERLLAESPVRLIKSVSATTRPPRKHEVHGKDYYFLTPEEFTARRSRGEFLECAEVHGTGNWYGTLQSEIQRARELGGWALLEIDVQGAQQIMQRYPQALTIFLRTSSETEYEKRLRGRGTEAEDVIQRRLANARNELKQAPEYRFQVVNDDLAQAVREIVHIISSWEAELHAR